MKSLRARRIGRLAAIVLAMGLAASGLAACSSGGSTSTGTTSSGAPELKNITVGVLYGADGVPFQIAEDKGFFRQAGLNVKAVPMTTTNLATPQLLAGTMDFSVENYVGMLGQEKAVPKLNLRIVVDGDQTSPNSVALMVPKNSPITSLAQLKGKTVGFPAPGINFGSLGLSVLGKPYSVSQTSYKTAIVPFPNVLQELSSGSIVAGMAIEPFLTIMEQSIGARPLVDLMSGPMAAFPVTCWVTTSSFTQKNPKTVAAFQAAMTKAEQVAATDPSYVRQELPRFVTTMSPKLASVITLPVFNPTVSLARLQRVATVMEEVGALPKNFDVSSMIYTPPSSS